MPDEVKLSDSDIHPHLRIRMRQRGITKEEIEEALSRGKQAEDAKIGTYGKALVFPYNRYWEGKFYEEKEVTVYYKLMEGKLLVLTVKARYGERFEEAT
jgi:hypothetical protein